jgi:HSP20 family protein
MSIRDLVPWGRRGSDVPARREDVFPFVGPFMDLRDQMNRMFDQFFRGMDLEPWSLSGPGGMGLGPHFEWTEDDQEYRMTVELPGLDEKDLEVRLTNDVLTLRGSKQQEQKDESAGTLRRAYDSFQRTIPLPPGVDRDQIRAELSKGLLSVTLPKTEEARKASRRIEVHGKD